MEEEAGTAATEGVAPGAEGAEEETGKGRSSKSSGICGAAVTHLHSARLC